MPCTDHIKYRIVQNVYASRFLKVSPQKVHPWSLLLPTEPARDAGLGLAGLLLDLLVELVDLLDGGSLGVLCVRCGVVLAFLELGLGLGELSGVIESAGGAFGMHWLGWVEE